MKLPVAFGVVLLLAAACGSSSKSSTAASPGSSSNSASPGTMFSTASVANLGTVIVDGKGRTIYVLTADGKTNKPCDDSSGCTKVWPDLPLPDGTTSANAGTGAQASLLSAMKLGDGETYPTYNKWLMYEFTGDSGPGQGNGEGIKSFGGTWYALDASGHLVQPGGGGSTPTSASSGNSGSSSGY